MTTTTRKPEDYLVVGQPLSLNSNGGMNNRYNKQVTTLQALQNISDLITAKSSRNNFKTLKAQSSNQKQWTVNTMRTDKNLTIMDI
jgi:hypothetical protein